jgi:2-polyprenyl-3-methyl-5-hydroxy-6-metoxy-1,4-benzoquinol methylase
VSDADRDRWEARYENDPGADRTDPDPLLAEALAHAPGSGRAIDLACGRGRHAIALAKADYEVEAVDISPRALSAARELARGLEILWQAADLDEFEMAEATYAVVCCVDFSDRARSFRPAPAP